MSNIHSEWTRLYIFVLWLPESLVAVCEVIRFATPLIVFDVLSPSYLKHQCLSSRTWSKIYLSDLKVSGVNQLLKSSFRYSVFEMCFLISYLYIREIQDVWVSYHCVARLCKFPRWFLSSDQMNACYDQGSPWASKL